MEGQRTRWSDQVGNIIQKESFISFPLELSVCTALSHEVKKMSYAKICLFFWTDPEHKWNGADVSLNFQNNML
jgi:hypothetical protein